MHSAQPLEWLLLKRTSILTILQLGAASQYVSELARKLNSNFSSIDQLLRKLESHELVKFQRKAGRKYALLTPHGFMIKQQLLQLLELLGSKPSLESESGSHLRLRELEQELTAIKSKLDKLESLMGVLNDPLGELELKLQQFSAELDSPQLTKIQLGKLLRRLGPCIRDIKRNSSRNQAKAQELLVRAEQLSQLARAKSKLLRA